MTVVFRRQCSLLVPAGVAVQMCWGLVAVFLAECRALAGAVRHLGHGSLWLTLVIVQVVPLVAVAGAVQVDNRDGLIAVVASRRRALHLHCCLLLMRWRYQHCR